MGDKSKGKGGHSKGKTKLTKKEMKAQNHQKLMESRKNKFEPTVIHGGAQAVDSNKKAA